MKIHQLGQTLLDTHMEGKLKYGHLNIPGYSLYNPSTTTFNIMLQTTVSETP
jgi:hypothetical protein